MNAQAARQGFLRFWLADWPHPALAGFAFGVVFAVVSGQYKIFIPLAVLVIAVDAEISYRRWRKTLPPRE